MVSLVSKHAAETDDGEAARQTPVVNLTASAPASVVVLVVLVVDIHSKIDIWNGWSIYVEFGTLFVAILVILNPDIF